MLLASVGLCTEHRLMLRGLALCEVRLHVVAARLRVRPIGA
jgi:hypothetical protein